MANVEHSTITDPNLHEPKGISAASADELYFADGGGSGTWQSLTDSTLGASAVAFSSKLLHIQETTDSTALVATDWATVTLDTVVTNQISGASLSTNTIILPAGTYHADGTTYVRNAGGINLLRTRLYNDTASTTALAGHTTFFMINGVHVPIRGRFTLASTSNIKFQIYSSGVNPSLNVGTGEILSDILIWKVS